MIEMEQEETKVDITEGLRGMAKGSVRFTIKADDTLENFHVHAAFKEFCRIDCDNNYTQGLRKLLEAWETNSKDEMVFNVINEHGVAIEELRQDVADLKATPKKSTEEKVEAF